MENDLFSINQLREQKLLVGFDIYQTIRQLIMEASEIVLLQKLHTVDF
jgi:hypothetical protein